MLVLIVMGGGLVAVLLGDDVIDVATSANYVGDCRELLALLPEACVQTCITSPPYWKLRDYGQPGQLGLEETLDGYIGELVKVFRGVRRALREDGTLWLNIGDTSAGSYGSRGRGTDNSMTDIAQRQISASPRRVKPPSGPGLKDKDIIGVPWELAFALRRDGWYLRSDIIWHKPNPLPDPACDRPTKSHEYIFLLSKRPSYFYDADAIRTPLSAKTLTTFGSERRPRSKGTDGMVRVRGHNLARDVPRRRAKVDADGNPVGANKRSVWTVATTPYDGAHFATFPPKLIEPCILAGSRGGDLVLDPFFGSGTTGMVAEKHGRRWIGFDLGYDDLAKARTAQRSFVLGGSE